jgi:hypothetical protein
VQLGRRDATKASFDAAQNNLPSPFSDLSSLISEFSKKGFTAQEMVTLSGKTVLPNLSLYALFFCYLLSLNRDDNDF